MVVNGIDRQQTCHQTVCAVAIGKGDIFFDGMTASLVVVVGSKDGAVPIVGQLVGADGVANGVIDVPVNCKPVVYDAVTSVLVDEGKSVVGDFVSERCVEERMRQVVLAYCVANITITDGIDC